MEPRLTLCPRCGSHEVHADQLTPLGQRYGCPDCGYEGSFVIEADSMEDARRIRQELQADREAEEGEGGDEDEDS